MNTRIKSVMVILMLSVTSISQAATYGGGSGTAEDPYQIWTAEQMNTIGLNLADWSRYFKLMADIDMSAYTGTSYHIIGTSWDIPFTGTFDGNGHVITNLTVAAPSEDDVGLFGYVGPGGQIKNLGLENVNITGKFGVGGLVGVNYSGTIAACYATGSVNGSDYVGGLVGKNFYGSITSCHAAGSVKGYSSLGGLVGVDMGGSITACYATDSVSGLDYVGGLVGHTDSGTITACYATGSVSGFSYVGGLVGTNYSGTITSCYATGFVSGFYNYVGGLVGLNYEGTVTSCYATGSVSGSYDYVGGLVGWNYEGTITACFWDTQTSGRLDSAGGTGKTTAEMQTISTFIDAGWDFTIKDGDPADWRMPLSSYPKLEWEDYPSYCGDIDHPYPVMDFNQDCRVDLADFALFAAHWLECTAPECD